VWILQKLLQYNKDLKELSRSLRKNMTDAEKLLWLNIKDKQFSGFQFYRQKVIGNYIVDFYCPKASLIMESFMIYKISPNPSLPKRGIVR